MNAPDADLEEVTVTAEENVPTEAHAVGYRILLVSPEPALASQYMQLVCGTKESVGSTEYENRSIIVETVSLDPGSAPVQSGLAQTDAVMLLLRHLDVESLRAAKALMDRLTIPSNTQQIVLTFRESGGRQFKINCTCGQKLLVSEAEEGRKGRCPACGTKFVIPSEATWLRAQGVLTDGMLLYSATIGHRSLCRVPLEEMVKSIVVRERAMKSQTMRIDIAGDTRT